jgi:hypothetical protein
MTCNLPAIDGNLFLRTRLSLQAQGTVSKANGPEKVKVSPQSPFYLGSSWDIRK